MLVGVLGPSISVETVLAEARKNSLPVECIPLVYSHYTETVGIIEKYGPRVDGFLFTGTTPYFYSLQHLNPEIPWDYLPRSTESLLCAILKAVYLNNYDISSISVDSYDENSLRAAYLEIGLAEDRITLLAHPFHLLSSDYTERIVDFHKDNLQSKRANFCLTGMQAVYEALFSEGYPVTKAFATSEVILQQLQKLYLAYKTVTEKEHRMAVLSVQFKFSCERSLYGKSELQFFLHGTKAMGAIYAFAQRLGAAVEPYNNELCHIYTTEAAIEAETKGFSGFKLLAELQKIEGVVHVAIGIGLGESPADAKYHAGLGKNRALKTPRSSYFVVHENHEIMGPVFGFSHTREEIQVDSDLNQISRRTGIGLETLHRLERAVRTHGIETTTPREIASLCNLAPNNMNRILIKLEQCGYVKVVGKQPSPTLGRPSRLIRFLLWN